MAQLPSVSFVPRNWYGQARIETGWVVQTIAESDAAYHALVALACLLAVVVVAAVFWVTSLSTHE